MNNVYYVENMKVAVRREDIQLINVKRREVKELEKRIIEDKIKRNSYVPKYHIKEVDGKLVYSRDTEALILNSAKDFEKLISRDKFSKALVKRCRKGKLKVSSLKDKLMDRFGLEERYSKIVGGVAEGVVASGVGVGLINASSKIAYADVSGLDEVGGQIIRITTPIMRLFASLGYPITWGMLIAGILLIVTGKKSKGMETIKWACLGYVALQLVPFGLGVLDSIGRALTDSLNNASMSMPIMFDSISKLF